MNHDNGKNETRVDNAMYKWVEWDKGALGVFSPAGWDFMDCLGGLSEIEGGQVFFSSGWNLTDCLGGLSGIKWS